MRLTPTGIFQGTPARTFLASANERGDIVLWRANDGRAHANVPHRHVVHSPTGFEYGYAGSGPLELALNILAEFVPPPDAWALHRQFVSAFLLGIDKPGGTIWADTIRAWIENEWAEERLPARVTA